MKKLLYHRSVQIFFLIALYFILAPFLPSEGHRALYAISLFIKDLLLWILPITVMFFIAYAIFSFDKRAPLFILILFLFEALSNMANVWYAYGCGQIATPYLSSIDTHSLNDLFSPLWRLPSFKPTWWSADKGSFAGVLLGLIISFKSPSFKALFIRGKTGAEWLLTRFFARLIPLFVLGFVARMHETALLHQMLSHYSHLLVWLVCFLIVYMLFLFVLGSGFSRDNFLKSIRNLLPAAGIAFSSGCSLSTMPWTIEGVSKNLKHRDLAKAVIPATTNIQQVGDCIANAFLCFLIYTHFHGQTPPFSLWVPFSVVFVLARFATAAVLGGAIFIMLPIYESYLGFTPEMSAILLALNVILDPLITCTNVMGNGALCRIFERVWERVRLGVAA